jgi:hypothetical protein
MAPSSRSRRSAEYCFIRAASHESHFSATRSETLDIVDEYDGFDTEDDRCSVKGGGYTINEETRVWVLNGSGDLIALSSLSEGQYNPLGTPDCTFTFAAKEVPDSDFYEFVVGRRDNPIPSQKDLVYSQAEIEADGWSVSIHLG